MSCVLCFFFFKQKTAYEMRISDWSSDVCSSDLSSLRCTVRHRLGGKRAGALSRLQRGLQLRQNAGIDEPRVDIGVNRLQRGEHVLVEQAQRDQPDIKGEITAAQYLRESPRQRTRPDRIVIVIVDRPVPHDGHTLVECERSEERRLGKEGGS